MAKHSRNISVNEIKLLIFNSGFEEEFILNECDIDYI
jgi:hypothetical protein